MAKNSATKTAGISMAGFQPKARVFDGQTLPSSNPTKNEEAPPRKITTGVGIVFNALSGKDAISKDLLDAQSELVTAKGQLSAIAEASFMLSVDPKSIRRSKWANRHAAEFATEDFQELKREIENAGENIQPIKVRHIDEGRVGVFDGQTPIYEIVYGHRRHQACTELGLHINVIVAKEMDDRSLFKEMDRENRGRKNLSAWEQGQMYVAALDQGLYPSLRTLAEDVGANLSDVSRAIKLARLPKFVIEAFETPLDLQVRWAKDLGDSLIKDPDFIQAAAKEISKKRNGLSPVDIFQKLIGRQEKAAGTAVEISGKGRLFATSTTGKKGRAVLDFEPGVLTEAKYAGLADLVRKYLNA
jgi:ParB family chromosome partitioning protein